MTPASTDVADALSRVPGLARDLADAGLVAILLVVVLVLVVALVAALRRIDQLHEARTDDQRSWKTESVGAIREFLPVLTKVEALLAGRARRPPEEA